MNNEIRFIIDVLKGSLSKSTQQLNLVDPIEVAKVAHLHRISALLYYALLNQELLNKESYLEALRQDHFESAQRYVSQTQAQKELEIKLNTLKFPYFFFKGHQLSNYYPEPYLRSMSDLDLLLWENDRESFSRELEKMGYSLSSKQLNEWIFKKDRIFLEVHTKLVHPSDVNLKVASYFSSITKKLLGSHGSIKMSDEDLFIYLLCHLSKHLYGSGAGLRFILDLVYAYQRMNLDETILRDRLIELNMYDFGKVVFSLMRRWFEIGPLEDSISSHQTDVLETMICGESVFGNLEKQGILIKARRIQRQTSSSKIWVMIFPKDLTFIEQIKRAKVWILHPFKTTKQYQLIKQKENQACAWLEELKEIGLYD
jgi:hypothetical protein